MQKSGTGLRPNPGGGESDPMTFAEIGGEGGKIVDFKVEPDDLIDIQYSAKRLRLEDEATNGVQVRNVKVILFMTSEWVMQ